MIKKAVFLILTCYTFVGFSMKDITSDTIPSDSVIVDTVAMNKQSIDSVHKVVNEIIQGIVELDSIQVGDAKKDTSKSNRLFRIGLGMGASKRFGSLDQIPTDYHFYYNDLKMGGYYQLSVDYGHFNKMNIGITYNQHQANKLLPNEDIIDSLGNISSGIYSDNIKIRQLMLRISSKKYLGGDESVVVWSSIGVGMAYYTQQTQRADLTYIYTGNSIIVGVSSGIDVFITKHIALGAEFNFNYGSLGKVTLEVVLEEIQKINLSKLEFGIGCRYYF